MIDLANLESVVITDDLRVRPTRTPDHAMENRALGDLARELATPSGPILQKIADSAVELCDAHSALISLADDDHQGFTWHVAAGQWAACHGHRVPRDASPCGIVSHCDAAQLFARPERCFAALAVAQPDAEEALVVPIDAGDHALGTLWVISHDPNRRFDIEDLRIATTLSALAAAVIGAGSPGHAQAHAAEREELAAALREADRRKDIFLATLAHELRNPLAPVMNSLEIMRRAGGEPLILRDAIATMQRQMTQMVRMVDDLVDVSRIIRDELELRKSRTSLSSVVAAAVEACQPLAMTLGHDVRVELLPTPVHVDADPARLTQVFGNLLNNACKFTDRGGTIVVSARRVDGDVEVRVKDTGVGISPDHQSEVFEMFAHVDRQTGHPQAGLGIGLHLVKKLVEMHGGSVSVLSPGRGHGSEFTVRLPVLAEHVKAKSASPEPVEPRPATPRRRILVVDDNQDAAMSLAVLLKVTGHETQMAADGVEALQKASIYRPDVILLDISLPRMNGYDTCRAMRQQWWGRKAVIVALTGWGQDEDRSKSESAGFNGHFVKPVDHAELMKFITETTAG